MNLPPRSTEIFRDLARCKAAGTCPRLTCRPKKLPADLQPEEARACSRFLAEELEMIRPTVVACMGESAFWIAMEHTLPNLSFSPLPVLLTHYSLPSSARRLFGRWEVEFERVNRGLRARRVATPAWA